MSVYKKNQGKQLPALESPHKRRLIEIARLARYEPVASIPNINNDFNYTYAKEGHLKRKPKIQPLQSHQSHQSTPKPDPRHSPPGHRLPKIDSKPNKIEYHPTNTSEQQHLLTLDTRLQTEDLLVGSNVKSSPHSPKESVLNNRRKIRDRERDRDRDRERYRLAGMDEEDSSEDDQYSTNATPGPGYYSVCDNSSFHSTGSRKGFTDFSFGSRMERFKEPKPEPLATVKEKKNPESLQKEIKRVVRRKKLIPFLSCSFKQNDSLLKQKVPGPQDYNPRTGIQQQLIRKIQRNFKGNFGVCEQRFKSNDEFAHLGPGCYSPEHPNQQQTPGSYYFKSQKKRFL